MPGSGPSATVTNAAGGTVTVAGTATVSAIPAMSGTAVPLPTYYFPTPISWGAPHLEMLIPTNNQDIEWKYRALNSSDGTTWYPTNDILASLGGVLSTIDKSIAAVSRTEGSVDVFVIGTDGEMFHDSRDGGSATWAGWESRGGGCITAPEVVAWDSDRLDMFVLGTDNALYHQYWDGTAGWSSYERVGGNWTVFTPTVATWGQGRLDAFVVDPTTKELFHSYWDQNEGSIWLPSSLGFESLGGFCTSRPIVVSTASGKLDVFVRGGDAGLWHLSFSQSSGWSTWTSISGGTAVQGEPAAVFNSSRIDVFAWGADTSLLHKRFDGSAWTPSGGFDICVSGNLGGPPKAVSDSSGSLQVVYFGTDDSVNHLAYSQPSESCGSSENLGTSPI
jgi:hypothetical protein